MVKTKKFTSSDIKKLIGSKNLIIGTIRTIKNLKLGKLDKIILSSNCPENILNDINYYAKNSDAEIIKTEYPNEELGIVCKKPFSISVISILKGVN